MHSSISSGIIVGLDYNLNSNKRWVTALEIDTLKLVVPLFYEYLNAEEVNCVELQIQKWQHLIVILENINNNLAHYFT